MDSRKRLAWASCYICDRLISVRIGRAFWSRGPGPTTGLSSKDFPSLQPRSSGDEDLAKIYQATLDLTQLYSNVHDVLYSGMRTSGQMMLMGDYVKYVDDFRSAISRWHRIWGTITCMRAVSKERPVLMICRCSKYQSYPSDVFRILEAIYQCFRLSSRNFSSVAF